MDNHWNCHGAEGGKPRVERKANTLEESQRKTAGPEATAFYAKLNRSVVPEDTYKNYDFVNDGNGGFREAISIDETLDYGEGRVGRVKSKLGDSHTTWITMVFHLPYSLCEEIPNYYPRLDDDGNQKYNTDGTPAMRSRWVIAEGMEDEAKRYFDEVVKFYCSNVLPGGVDAFHGGSVNLDESRPHLQGIADAFEEDPRSKDPDGDLKNGFSLAMGSHRKSRKIPKVDKTGEAVLDDQGNSVMVREGAREKSERFHRELKAHMLAAGFDIEAERDPVRHNRRVDLPDFQDIRDREAITEERTAAAEEATAEAEAIRYEVEGREEDALLDQAEAAETSQWLTDAWVESEEPALRERAEEEGYEAGEAEGREEWGRRYHAARKRGWEKGTEQARERYSEAVEKGHAYRDQKKAELDTARKKITQVTADAVTKAVAAWEADELPTLRQTARKETQEAVKAEMQPDLDAAAADRQEASRLVEQVRARETALNRREARNKTQKQSVKDLFGQVDGLATLAEESVSTIDDTLDASDQTFKTLHDIGMALPKDQQKKFFEVTRSRFAMSVERIRELRPDGKLLNEQVKGLQRDVDALASQFDDEDDGNGKPKGGDPQPGS